MLLGVFFFQCVCVTACGNFAVIGYDSGHVDRFNMQSGLHRASYSLPQDKLPQPHLPFSSNPVRGVASHMLNQVCAYFLDLIPFCSKLLFILFYYF